MNKTHTVALFINYQRREFSLTARKSVADLKKIELSESSRGQKMVILAQEMSKAESSQMAKDFRSVYETYGYTYTPRQSFEEMDRNPRC